MKPLRLLAISFSLLWLCSFPSVSQIKHSFTIEQALSAPFPESLVAAPKDNASRGALMPKANAISGSPKDRNSRHANSRRTTRTTVRKSRN